MNEPDGIDFIISGKPLTEKERKAISEFIKVDKEKIAKQKLRKVKSALVGHSPLKTEQRKRRS